MLLVSRVFSCHILHCTDCLAFSLHVHVGSHHITYCDSIFTVYFKMDLSVHYKGIGMLTLIYSSHYTYKCPSRCVSMAQYQKGNKWYHNRLVPQISYTALNDMLTQQYIMLQEVVTACFNASHDLFAINQENHKTFCKNCLFPGRDFQT